MRAYWGLLFVAWLWASPVAAQEAPQGSAAGEQGQAAANGEQVQKQIKELTEIDDPFRLRDPFRSNLEDELKRREREEQKRTGVGFGSDVALDEININELKVTGVLMGEKRRAFAQAGQRGSTLVLKEGMKIGPDEVTLKAILPGGIVLVEKINNVYGQEEYLETIIPIAEEIDN